MVVWLLVGDLGDLFGELRFQVDINAAVILRIIRSVATLS